MNKLFTKIAGLSLGLAMAIGVGVAVGANQEAIPVHAAVPGGNELLFTINFKDNKSDSSTVLTAATFYSNGVTSVTDKNGSTVTSTFSEAGISGTPSKVYPGKGGLKCGSNNNAASFTLNIPSAYQAKFTYAVINCTNATRSITLTAGGGSDTLASGNSSFGDYDLSISSTSTATTLDVSITSANKTAAYIASIAVYKAAASTPLTGITLGGAASSNAMSIGSSDLTAKTVSVTLNPSGATDQKVNIAHQSGTSGLFTVSTSATCTSGSGSFTVTGKGNTSGSETFRIFGNTETSVYVDLVVTALDDSVTYWTVSFDSDGGASIADMKVKDGEKFEFPSPGTKTHYSFDGWSSDGGNTLYDAGDESPAVDDDIEYKAYWTEDAKYTVTYVHGDHGTGDDYVVNNVYGGLYTLATFATAGFKASSGYSFKKWSVGGVEYAEGASISISGATTVTALYSEVKAYTLVTDASDLVEGTQFILLHASIDSIAIGGWNSSYFTTVSTASVSGSQAVCDDAMVFTLEGSSGAWKVKCGDYYYGLQNSTTALRAESASATGNNYSWTISITNEIASMKTAGSGTRSLCYNSGTNPTRYSAYNASSTYTEVRMFAIIPEVNELDSVTTSGQNTSFTAGNKWSYGGTLTAHYTVEADATVTPTSFKFGDSGIDPTSAGTAITTSTTLTKAEHDGKYIYVIYTEDNVTKYCSYQITVNYAAVTSVVIDQHAAEIGLEELYDGYKKVGVTVNSQYADQGYEWIVSANTVDDDYLFDASGLLAGDTVGTITLRCRSTADNSKYDELVVTVTGDPVVDITPASVSGYVGKSADVDFTYGNIDNVELIDFASSNPSVLTVGDHIEDSGEGVVTINFVGAGNATLSVSYNRGSTLDSITVTVSTDSVTTLTWSAPTIKVYSGATTTVSDASSWNVHYTMASGDEGDLSYGEYTLKLGGSSITLPHIWDASEDGKVLSIEYGGFASPTTSTVDVTQSLRPVNAPVPGEESTKTWTATKKEDFGSTIDSVNDTDSGSVTFNNGSTMSYERTLEYVASGKADYLAFSSNYIQFGSSNALEKLVLTAATSGTVTSVVVDCWAKNGGSNISVTVGGNAFDSSKTCPSAGAEVTFNGSATGTVVITMEKSDKTAGLAQYIKSVAITTVEDSGETTNIANVAGHEAAQKAVVKFAKAFNTALGATEHCTTGLDAAWSTATTAWSTFNSDIALLSADEQTYAKNLIKYASAQYTDDTDNDYSYCLERAMATYEACIQKHGQTAFMSDVRLVSASSRIAPLSFINGDGNTIAIIVVISMISITAIGGYFFLRRRKED